MPRRLKIQGGGGVGQEISKYPKNKVSIRVFPKIGVPQNGWFIMENPIKMFGNIHLDFW